jgi:hypothetical protein
LVTSKALIYNWHSSAKYTIESSLPVSPDSKWKLERLLGNPTRTAHVPARCDRISTLLQYLIPLPYKLTINLSLSIRFNLLFIVSRPLGLWHVLLEQHLDVGHGQEELSN